MGTKPKRIQRKRTKGQVKQYRSDWHKSKTRPRAECHPDKPHRARGMCNTCYDRWLYASSPKQKQQKTARNNAWKKRNSSKVKVGQREHKLRIKYGMTISDYDAMFVKQGGACAICKKTGLMLHVDHDHSTGKIRELLCLRCNGSLAWVESLIKGGDFVNAATSYLKKHGVINA